MKCEVLISAMNQKDISLIKKMNINSNAILINQCKENSFDMFENNNNIIKFYSFNERGVGLSRNTALMRAEGDIVVFADEDEIFVDNYESLILNEFVNNPKADVILFNVESLNPSRKQYTITKAKKINQFCCGKYGAVRIALRLNKIREKNIYFSLLFGGGAKYQNGEDSLFLHDCLKKGLSVYTSPIKIGYVKQEDSTWFKGYNEKYFNDRGVLLKKMYGPFFVFMCFRFLIKTNKYYKKDMSFKAAFLLMLKSK